MVSRIVSLFALMGALVCGSATDVGARVRVGIEGGLNAGQATWSPNLLNLDLRYRAAWSAGVTVDVPLASQLSLSTGLRHIGLRENTSVSFVSIGGGGTMWQHLSFHYVGVPLLLRFSPAAARGLFLTAGGEAQYLAVIGHEEGGTQLLVPASATRATRSPAAPASTIFEDVGTYGSDPNGLYRPWNLAVSGGLGWEFPLRQHGGVIETRYTHGLTDIVRSDAVARRTRGFEALIGFLW